MMARELDEARRRLVDGGSMRIVDVVIVVVVVKG